MSSAKKLLEAAAGNAGGGSTDVSDVFSTFLYTGDGSAQVLDNGIDLDGEGGMVWYRSRAASNNSIEDTVRGLDKVIYTDTTAAEADPGIYGVQAFNSNGFTAGVTVSGTKNVSWTFRKAPKFFDIVTYTGNGASGRLIDHNLGSAPGMVTVKSTSTSGTWWSTYHRGTAANSYVLLNGNQRAESNGFTRTVSSTQYELGPNWADENQNGRTYVAYFFAHNNNDGEFGPDADQDIISCGSYTGNGSATGPVITLGWEPQWILLKEITGANDWFIVDVMRGIPAGLADSLSTLNANWSVAENVEYAIDLKATGFQIKDNHQEINNSGDTYIYMAIRAPMITEPEAATEVFAVDEMDNSPTSPPSFYSNFPVDMAFYRNISTTVNTNIQSRLTGLTQMQTNLNAQETAYSFAQFDFMDGWFDYNAAQSNVLSWMWKRAKGYFDVVCYNGTGSVRTVAHSLGVAPEMMWIKNRDTAIAWAVYHKDLGNAKAVFLNDDQAEFSNTSIWNSTTPTDTNFTLGTYGNAVNQSGADFVAYLFATLDGISKVGSVSHSGSSTDVNCGFSNGARFVMLKRTDAAGDYYYWDSLRGIVAGNDPYMLLNTTAAQVTNTDYIDPLSSGFQISGDFTDGTYLFYAIA
mgnify:FL=1